MEITAKQDASTRRIAARNGLRAIKSRDRSEHINNLGGFMLIDECSRTVVAGSD